MSRSGRAVIAIVAAGAAVYLAGWFDGSVMTQIQRQSGIDFDPNGLILAMSLGSIAVMGSILALGVPASRSQAALVGAVYIVTGAFLAFLPVIVWRFAATINDALPVLPQPISQAVSQFYSWSNGPLNAEEYVGAGVLITGMLVIGRAFRDRPVGPVAGPQPQQR
jgi:hypothetical protein